MVERQIISRGVEDKKVLNALRSIPRHLFVPEEYIQIAYEDHPVPIGFGQTISQPYIVAVMTQSLLDAGMPNSVLEIGTGCGYQTAVLANIFPQVYTVERIEALHKLAKQRLAELELFNVQFRHTDGNGGWPNPNYHFDRIMMTAACTEIPEALTRQLSNQGVMIFPFDNGIDQTLTQVTKTTKGLESVALEKVSFVPLLPGLA